MGLRGDKNIEESLIVMCQLLSWWEGEGGAKGSIMIWFLNSSNIERNKAEKLFQIDGHWLLWSQLLGYDIYLCHEKYKQICEPNVSSNRIKCVFKKWFGLSIQRGKSAVHTGWPCLDHLSPIQ